MTLRFLAENSLAAAAFITLGVIFCCADEERLSKLEKLTRERWSGMFMGWVALALCVPHAEVVSPAFLIPLLWPLAAVIPVLCFFYIDYCMARAFAGLVIIYAYDLVHSVYESKIPLAAVVTVAAWLIGIAGIWISGKPCALRDWFRISAKKRRWKYLCAACSFISGACAVYALIAVVCRELN